MASLSIWCRVALLFRSNKQPRWAHSPQSVSVATQNSSCGEPRCWGVEVQTGEVVAR